jgi:hypothetical protein
MRISRSLSLLARPRIANRSRDRENNDISSVKITILPLRAMVFYKPNSLPHFGKLMQTNEVVALLGMRRLSRRCGWIIYTIHESRHFSR